MRQGTSGRLLRSALMAGSADVVAGLRFLCCLGPGGGENWVFEPIFQTLHHRQPSLPTYYAWGGSERARGGGGHPVYIPQNDPYDPHTQVQQKHWGPAAWVPHHRSGGASEG